MDPVQVNKPAQGHKTALSKKGKLRVKFVSSLKKQRICKSKKNQRANDGKRKRRRRSRLRRHRQRNCVTVKAPLQCAHSEPHCVLCGRPLLVGAAMGPEVISSSPPPLVRQTASSALDANSFDNPVVDSQQRRFPTPRPIRIRPRRYCVSPPVFKLD
jgi:hypothetical protein